MGVDGGDADMDASADAGPMDPVTLTPYAGACTPVAPFAGVPAREECGHWSAARFAPRTAAGEVLALRYVLNDDTDSSLTDPGLAHRIRFFSATGDAPPARLSGALTLDVPNAPAPSGMDRAVELTLDEPFLVSAGEALYVAFEMVCSPGRTYPALGVDLCGSAPGTYWWSQASGEPYDWLTHESFGFEPAAPLVSVTFRER